MFCASVLVVRCSAAEADDYYVAGIALAVSFVNEGPAPSFFSDELFQAVVSDPDKVHVGLDSVWDGPMKDDLQQFTLMYFLCMSSWVNSD